MTSQTHDLRGSHVATLPPVGRVDGWLLSRLGRVLGPLQLRLVLWDGSDLSLSPDCNPLASFHLRTRRALLGLLWNPDLRFGEAYEEGEIEVHGDLVGALEAVYRALGRRGSGWRRASLGGGHSIRASRANVHSHYDLNNDFFRLWLDRQMAYTCAYFPSPDCSLEQAQIAKFDHVLVRVRHDSSQSRMASI